MFLKSFRLNQKCFNQNTKIHKSYKYNQIELFKDQKNIDTIKSNYLSCFLRFSLENQCGIG